MTLNKFVLTGMPRSGTTYFLQEIDKLENVSIPKVNFHYEPFATLNINFILNYEDNIERLTESVDTDYFGFKIFAANATNYCRLVDDDFKFIILLRKNFWKTFGSAITARQNSDYIGSSKKYVLNDNDDKHFVQSMENAVITMLQQYYDYETYWRNHPNTLGVFYFEDLIKPNASFELLNDYFKQKIVFNANYDDSFSADKYFPKLHQKELLKWKVQTRISVPTDIPDYLWESFLS